MQNIFKCIAAVVVAIVLVVINHYGCEERLNSLASNSSKCSSLNQPCPNWGWEFQSFHLCEDTWSSWVNTTFQIKNTHTRTHRTAIIVIQQFVCSLKKKTLPQQLQMHFFPQIARPLFHLSQINNRVSRRSVLKPRGWDLGLLCGATWWTSSVCGSLVQTASRRGFNVNTEPSLTPLPARCRALMDFWTHRTSPPACELKGPGAHVVTLLHRCS